MVLAKPCPSTQHPNTLWTPPGSVTPPPLWQPIPVPDHPFREAVFPNIQPEPSLVQVEAIPSSPKEVKQSVNNDIQQSNISSQFSKNNILRETCMISWVWHIPCNSIRKTAVNHFFFALVGVRGTVWSAIRELERSHGEETCSSSRVPSALLEWSQPDKHLITDMSVSELCGWRCSYWHPTKL